MSSLEGARNLYYLGAVCRLQGQNVLPLGGAARHPTSRFGRLGKRSQALESISVLVSISRILAYWRSSDIQENISSTIDIFYKPTKYWE